MEDIKKIYEIYWKIIVRLLINVRNSKILDILDGILNATPCISNVRTIIRPLINLYNISLHKPRKISVISHPTDIPKRTFLHNALWYARNHNINRHIIPMHWRRLKDLLTSSKPDFISM